MCFSSFKNHKLKVKLWWVGDCKRKKTVIFLLFILSKGNFFQYSGFISMYSVLNTLSEYTCLYISKNITSCIFLLVFEIVEYLQCILKFVLIIFYKVIFKKIWKELLNTSKTARTDVFQSNVCTYTIQLKVLFIWKLFAKISLPFDFFSHFAIVFLRRAKRHMFDPDHLF